mmetsp:Transcript_45037/g.134571  ORF Transcript_45037/g.134571 Transcript_45037/m.134571 type:complete len:260 (+) Transcript_45037:875-1654(+)
MFCATSRGRSSMREAFAGRLFGGARGWGAKALRRASKSTANLSQLDFRPCRGSSASGGMGGTARPLKACASIRAIFSVMRRPMGRALGPPAAALPAFDLEGDFGSDPLGGGGPLPGGAFPGAPTLLGLALEGESGPAPCGGVLPGVGSALLGGGGLPGALPGGEALPGGGPLPGGALPGGLALGGGAFLGGVAASSCEDALDSAPPGDGVPGGGVCPSTPAGGGLPVDAGSDNPLWDAPSGVEVLLAAWDPSRVAGAAP